MFKNLRNPIFFLIALSAVFSLTNFINATASLLLYALTSFMIIKRGGNRIFRQKSFLFFNIFYIVFVLYGLIGYGTLGFDNYKAPLFDFIALYTVLLMSCCIRTMNGEQIRCLLFISLVAMTVSVGVATFVATINPMAIRICFGDINRLGTAEVSMYNAMGLMSYSQAHSLCVLCGGICTLMCYAKKLWFSFFALILLLAAIKLQFDMIITTALLLSVLCCACIVIIKISHGKFIISVGIIAIIIICFNSFVINLLGFAETENIQIFQKLNDLFATVETGTGQGQMGYRNELYFTSLRTFFSNPIFGLGKDNGSRMYIGEHSFLLDYLAYFGLFAFLYFIGWWKHFKSNVLNCLPIYKKECLCCFIPVVLLVLMKSLSVCMSLPFASLVFVQIVFFYLKYLEQGEYEKS